MEVILPIRKPIHKLEQGFPMQKFLAEGRFMSSETGI
jgi:hypothetical protein